MNRQLIAAMLAVLPLCAAGGAGDPADQYFSKNSPALTPQEKAAIAAAKKWQAGGATGSMPVPGTDGMVRYVVGIQQIQVVCAVLQVCDIELQPGEQVLGVNVGDPRFTIEPAVSGSGAGEVQHLIVKPHDVGLNTSLIVSTDRRTYHINLRSHRTSYMPRIGFIYPEDVQARLASARQREARRAEDETLPDTRDNIRNLSFDYSLTGSAPWKPVRVYNDGARTIIQMPESMKRTEAPVLLVLRRSGKPFGKDENVQVNYRLHGDRFIVDTVFQEAVLIAGIGNSQNRITITKEK